MMQSKWMSGIGGMLMASTALLWFATPTGAVQLESWDDKISNANQRFKVLNEFNREAVLDKETQLVWETTPQTAPAMWEFARFDCINKTTGGRKGWRLPSIHELASLVDPNNPVGNPDLPPGHPFTNVQSANYWSASTNAVHPSNAWNVNFFIGDVNTGDKTVSLQLWCVRGGHNHGSEY